MKESIYFFMLILLVFFSDKSNKNELEISSFDDDIIVLRNLKNAINDYEDSYVAVLENEKYKMKIQKPDPRIEFSMQIFEPNNSINYKSIIVDPEKNIIYKRLN